MNVSVDSNFWWSLVFLFGLALLGGFLLLLAPCLLALGLCLACFVGKGGKVQVRSVKEG